MNQADLLDQFVLEARECLEAIGRRLLDVERDPANEELLNDLFRSVHTLKGNCGLFEFRDLETVVHAGEDLLDQVRSHTLPYSPALADTLLDAMDYASRLVDDIERNGRIDPGAHDASVAHAAALRALLGGAAPAAPVHGAVPAMQGVASTAPLHPVDRAAPAWVARIPPALLASHPERLLVHYQPEPGCFFKGEDPWRLVTTAPGLEALHVDTREPWPQHDALTGWDCFESNLEFVLFSSAAPAQLQEHFRCVPEQVHYLEPAAVQSSPEDATGRVLRQRCAALWRDQIGLLARAGVAPGAVLAARRVLRHLAQAAAGETSAQICAELDALPDSVAAGPLLSLARRHAPEGNADGGEPAPQNAALESDTATGDPARRADDLHPGGGQRVLKVAQEKIDHLMDLIGEMVVAKNSLSYLAERAEEVYGQRELAREVKAQYAVINRIAEDMQHGIMQVRMLPVGTVFQRFSRLVRDISRKLGKEVQLVIEGEDTEADKNVIEPLADPLIHILRNSLDHGIELPEARRAAGKPAGGTIRIKAHQESDRVVIEISDDGAGVDPARVRAKAVERGLIPAERAATLGDEDAVQLIFLPGFSTAETISDLSGRGVGMDVVRNAVERINGIVELGSVKGKGTTLRLSLPLSMAVTNVMLIESAGRRFGVPMDLIVETVRVHRDDIHAFKNARTTVLRGRVVSLRALNDLLALPEEPISNAEGEVAVLVVRIGNESAGLLVDDFLGTSDIILKPLEGVLAGLTGFSGTALMGDGGVLMVLNPKELL